jgi:hypothetical protein
MDDSPSPPKVFGNHVIKQIVQHMLAEDMLLNFDDYQVIRVVFRTLGGSWSQLAQGNIVHLELLKKVVTAWGQMPGREKESDRLI